MSIAVAGYVIHTPDGSRILGWGETPDAAWLERHGEELFVLRPATAGLVALLEEHGGLVMWGLVDGVACTVAEERSCCGGEAIER